MSTETVKFHFENLKELAGSDCVRLQEPMSRHTTFQAGGPADYYTVPTAEEDFRKVLDYCRSEKLPFYIVGNGSNLLVSDQGFRGVILSTSGLTSLKTENKRIQAGAGVRLSAVAAEALRASLTGFEFAAGIPGSLGGAVYMNAGAYGGEMLQVVEKVTLLGENGEIFERAGEEMHFGYRYSRAMEENTVILGASLLLQEGDPLQIRAQMDELAFKRRSKQPLEYPSAGSTFKRPEGYFAGKLIQDAGLAGCRVGGACVSPKHCGFIVNDGKASAMDIYTLCGKVQKTVWEQYGVKLLMEVKMLGDFC